MLEIAKVSTGDSYVVRNWDNLLTFIKTSPHLSGPNKDLVYALEFAGRNGLRLPIAGLVSQLDVIPPK